MLYIIYDSALNGLPGLIALQQLYPAYRSLFKGTKDEMLSDVAPYLFTVGEGFAEQTKSLDIPREGMLVIDSDRELEKLCTHLQRFIYQTVKKQQFFFRFWDGRVLQKFLPTCEEAQLMMFFDGIRSITIKSEQGIKQFQFTPYGLQAAKTGLGKPGLIFGIVPEKAEELIV